MGIIGVWIGEYKYNQENYPSCKFELTISNISENKFEGVSNDVGGIPGKGVVEGHIIEDKIFFQKKMPHTYGITPEGKFIRLSGKHPIVYYQGEFDSLRGEYYGTWAIKRGIRFYGIMPVILKPTSGTWSMKKHSP